MTDTKKVYDSYTERLIKCLPMDDALFIAKLSAQELIPGDTDSKIKALPTQAEKASYFLNHVIKPALDIGYTAEFNKLLSVMQDCGYTHVKNLSCEIQANDDRSEHKSGSYIQRTFCI